MFKLCYSSGGLSLYVCLYFLKKMTSLPEIYLVLSCLVKSQVELYTMCDLLLGEGKGKGSTSYCVFYRHSSLEEKCTLGDLKQWLKMMVSISVQSHQYIRVLLHLSLAISVNVKVFSSPLKTRQNCQFFAVSTRDEKAGV